MDTVKNLNLPTMPKLHNDYVVVREDAWNTLLAYVSEQTKVINSLSRAVESLHALSVTQYNNQQREIKLLASEISVIAKALGGAYEDA
jgi:hypothetical protein